MRTVNEQARELAQTAKCVGAKARNVVNRQSELRGWDGHAATNKSRDEAKTKWHSGQYVGGEPERERWVRRCTSAD